MTRAPTAGRKHSILIPEWLLATETLAAFPDLSYREAAVALRRTRAVLPGHRLIASPSAILIHAFAMGLTRSMTSDGSAKSGPDWIGWHPHSARVFGERLGIEPKRFALPSGTSSSTASLNGTRMATSTSSHTRKCGVGSRRVRTSPRRAGGTRRATCSRRTWRVARTSASTPRSCTRSISATRRWIAAGVRLPGACSPFAPGCTRRRSRDAWGFLSMLGWSRLAPVSRRRRLSVSASRATAPPQPTARRRRRRADDGDGANEFPHGRRTRSHALAWAIGTQCHARVERSPTRRRRPNATRGVGGSFRRRIFTKRWIAGG